MASAKSKNLSLSAGSSKSTGKDTYLNHDMVEHLAGVILETIEDESKDDTEASDIVSALFTVLHRLLASMKPYEHPDDQLHNRQQISAALHELLAHHGMLIH